GLAVLGCLLDDPVLDVGEIHDLRDPIAVLQQHATEQVLEKKRAEVANVGEVVDRRPAGVHADVARLEGMELLDLQAHGVVQPQWRHGSSFNNATAWAASACPSPIGPR